VDVSQSGSAPVLDDDKGMLDPSEDDGDRGDDEQEDDDQRDDGREDDDLEDDLDKPVTSDVEEDTTDNFLEASGCLPKPKEDVRGWEDLRDKIKKDIEEAHKQNEPPKHINQLLILRNFATLQLRGDGRIVVSMKIAEQWTDGMGTHFARQIRFLARHYQLFEQLLPKKRGKYMNRSLLSDEQVQTAARTYLTGLPTGEVTPSHFRRMLNERILPSLGYTLTTGLSERTAWRWLVNLGWRSKVLRKGVYMDGHERPDVVEYRNNVFLRDMASHQKKMVRWEQQESELVRIDPVLMPGEKRIIAMFQDESMFHANEYRSTIWCVPTFLCPRDRSHDLEKGEGR